ncbi:MAG TPA: hypothetical protein DCP92_05830 [Nitrospiraceae bacterium]|jgi:hypothetical protein|nr:hypothetical protein [Nitrospiraceae bacterium]
MLVGKGKVAQGAGTLLIGMVLGPVYVVCLPVIGIVTVITVVGKKGVLKLLRNPAAFGWSHQKHIVQAERRGRTGTDCPARGMAGNRMRGII